MQQLAAEVQRDADSAEQQGEDHGLDERQGCGNTATFNFRFPDTSKRFPPPSSREVECTLHKLKRDVVRIYKGHKLKDSNISQDEAQFVKGLSKNEDVIVKQSDKCKGFVLIDRDTYKSKAEVILNDVQNYEKLEKNPVAQVEAKTKQVFKTLAKGKLPDKVVEELTPMHSRTPVFYGLPKDHKPTVPLRPVVSASGGPTEKTSCLLEKILKQLLAFVPTHLKDTRDFLSRAADHCRTHPLTEGAIFFSVDVVNLYGSIPIGEAIEAVREKLLAHGKDIDTFGLTYDDICALLDQCLNNNVFSFGDSYYRQKLGIAMGNPCAPPLAIIFLDRFEQQALGNAALKPEFLVRYIDDYAGIWIHGEEALLGFVDYLNSIHPNLAFTLDFTKDNKGVPFLDTLVTIETSQAGRAKLETELYIKPTNSGIVLHATSAHPSATKHSMIRNMFHRAYNNASSTSKAESGVSKIRALLLGNGYSAQLLKKLLRQVRQARSKGRAPKQTLGEDGFLTLPYIDEDLLCKVKKVVKKSGLDVKVAWRNDKKLKKQLVRSAFSKPQCPGGNRCNLCKTDFRGLCTQKNVVYRLKCKLCASDVGQMEYIGETKRPLRLRFNEHLRDMTSQKQDTPLGDHFRTCHPQTTGNLTHIDVEVLYRARDHPDRKIAESLLIRQLDPRLNSNVSSWPIM